MTVNLDALSKKLADNAPLTDEERQLAAKVLRFSDMGYMAVQFARASGGITILTGWPEGVDEESSKPPLFAAIGLDAPCAETWFLLSAALGNDPMAPMSLIQRLAKEIHAAWRDKRLEQGDEVEPEWLHWSTLDLDDQMMMSYIAGRVQRAVFAIPDEQP